MLANGTTISVAMIARNEEANLPRTLEGLRWVDEVVIVDSGSTDRTPEIAREYGAKHSFNRDFRGHAEQKNVAIRQCTGDWILLLDADEVVSPELAAELQSVLSSPAHQAYWIPRLNLFMRRWMRHGGLYPDEKLRLFKRGHAMVEEGVGPHGTPQYAESKGAVRSPLLHYGYPDFTLYMNHMNEYSTDGVEALLKKDRGSSAAALMFHALLNPLVAFLKGYVLKAGFLDGAEGLIFHLNHSVYVHWKYVKAWEFVTGGGVVAGARPRSWLDRF
ncbi:MAG TPA: glycosyltransferase family 2 protein [Acidobacteriaceae bacterium]|nr:glycosyltransferase family 2 protein [Acidobacteriaceae bacterium]